MIPVQARKETRTVTRMGRRVIQPLQPLSSSSPSNSIYYTNMNSNELMDNKKQHQHIAKVATNTLNLFEHFCDGKDQIKSHIRNKIGSKKIVKVYLAKH
jgi:hypothetical protein